jgi:hypothetical protein
MLRYAALCGAMRRSVLGWVGDRPRRLDDTETADHTQVSRRGRQPVDNGQHGADMGAGGALSVVSGRVAGL